MNPRIHQEAEASENAPERLKTSKRSPHTEAQSFLRQLDQPLLNTLNHL